MKQYNLILTIFLVIILGALLFTLVPFIYSELKSEFAVREALENFEETTLVNNEKSPEDIAEFEGGTLEDMINQLDNEPIEDEEKVESNDNYYTYSTNPVHSDNYQAIGKIEIPRTRISYPIYNQISRESLESGVAIAYGVGLNQTGNTVIYGHNFRNGKFFSNNKKLKSGDKIYITDLSGNKLTYTIYKIYVTNATDASYMVRDTEGRTEISLQTCTDDNVNRIVIWATAN